MPFAFNPFTGNFDYYINSSIGGVIVGGTAGSVLFVNPTGTYAQDNANFFYNATNKSLSLGTTSSIGKFATIGAISGVTTNGTINIGATAAAFDGVTADFFAGVAGGTYLAMNAPSGSSFNAFDIQVAGVSKLAMRLNDGVLTAPVGSEYRPGVMAYTSAGMRAASTAGTIALGYAGNASGYSSEIDVYGTTHATLPGLIEFRTGTASSQQAVTMTLSAVGNLGIGLSPAATNRLDVLDTTLAGSGSLNGSVVNIAQTWNTTGAPTAFKLNVTNTASNTGLTLSKLFDFQVGGVSKFFFDVNAGAFYYATGLIRTTNNYDLFNDNNAGLLSIYSTDTSGVGRVNINIASGIRATVKIADNVSYTTNAASTTIYSGLQVSPTCNVGASNSGGTFYGTRINPIFTATTGLTAAYIFAVSASSVDKFQVTSTGLVNCLIDGNSLQVGSGSNVAVYAGFAAQRGFFGYDGTSMLCQAGSGKALQFSVNSNTFTSGTVKLTISSAANLVGIGGTITNSSTVAGAIMTVLDAGTVGINVLTPNSSLQIAGSFAPAMITKATSYTATISDCVILVDSTAAIRTITLPTAVGIDGRQYTVKDWKGTAATNNITIATTSAQTIDGAASKVLTTNYGSLTFVSDGANWSII